MEKSFNRSMTYIAPLILKGFDINKQAMVNSYLFNLNNLELNDPSKEIEGLFIRVSYELETKNTFKFDRRCMDITDVDDKTFMVFIKTTEFFHKDIQLLFDGKYSEISEVAKNEIIRFWKFSSTSAYCRILHKDPVYKEVLEDKLNCRIDDDAELGDIMNIEKETFKEKLLTV